VPSKYIRVFLQVLYMSISTLINEDKSMHISEKKGPEARTRSMFMDIFVSLVWT